MHAIYLVSLDQWGGIAQYVLDLCLHFGGEGNKVGVVARHAPQVVERFKNAQLPIETMPLRGLLDPITSVRLASRLRACDEAVVHAFTIADAVAAINARKLSDNAHIAVVLTVADAKAWRNSTAYASTLSELDGIILPSERLRRDFLTLHRPLDPERVHAVAPGLGQKRLLPTPPDLPTADLPIIMAHGRIAPSLGLATLFDALDRLRDLPWRLRIAGEGKAADVGPLKQHTRRLAIADRVDWLGYRSDIHAVVPTALIGVVPAVERESLAMAALDYLHHTVALVASNAIPQADALANGTNALLVDPAGGPCALADALRLLLTNPQRRQQLAENGRNAYVDNMSRKPFDLLGQVYNKARK